MRKLVPLLIAAALATPIFAQGMMAPSTGPAQAEPMPKTKMKMMKKKPMQKEMKKKGMEQPPAQP